MGIRTLLVAVTISLVGICQSEAGSLAAPSDSTLGRALQPAADSRVGTPDAPRSAAEIGIIFNAAAPSASNQRTRGAWETSLSARSLSLAVPSLYFLSHGSLCAGHPQQASIELSPWPTLQREFCRLQI
jgi:hypothetical protein